MTSFPDQAYTSIETAKLREMEAKLGKAKDLLSAAVRAKGNADGRAALLAREVVELRAEVARLKQAPAVVMPDDTFTLDLDEFEKSLVRITINSKNRGVGYELCGTMGDGHFSRRTFDITPYLGHCLRTIGICAVPADRVLGDVVLVVDRGEWDVLRECADAVLNAAPEKT